MAKGLGERWFCTEAEPRPPDGAKPHVRTVRGNRLAKTHVDHSYIFSSLTTRAPECSSAYQMVSIGVKRVVEDCQKKIEQVVERSPANGDWGFCAYGDAPPAIGGGMQWFYWFDDKPAMFDFLKSCALFINPPRNDLDLPQLSSSLRSTIEKEIGGDLGSLRHELNSLLDGCSQFTWMGSFEELRSGDHPEVIVVRNNFHSSRDRLEDGSAIPDDELTEFTEFLNSYGL